MAKISKKYGHETSKIEEENVFTGYSIKTRMKSVRVHLE